MVARRDYALRDRRVRRKDLGSSVRRKAGLGYYTAQRLQGHLQRHGILSLVVQLRLQHNCRFVQPCVLGDRLRMRILGGQRRRHYVFVRLESWEPGGNNLQKYDLKDV